MADVMNTATKNIDASLKEPRHFWNANTILIALDAEGKKGRTSESEFAWLDLFDVWMDHGASCSVPWKLFVFKLR